MNTSLATTPEQAYRSLSVAAESIGRNNFARHLAIPESRRPKQFDISEAHRAVTDTMLDVMNGRCTPEEAVALLHRSDVEKERFADGW